MRPGYICSKVLAKYPHFTHHPSSLEVLYLYLCNIKLYTHSYIPISSAKITHAYQALPGRRRQAGVAIRRSSSKPGRRALPSSGRTGLSKTLSQSADPSAAACGREAVVGPHMEQLFHQGVKENPWMSGIMDGCSFGQQGCRERGSHSDLG